MLVVPGGQVDLARVVAARENVINRLEAIRLPRTFRRDGHAQLDSAGVREIDRGIGLEHAVFKDGRDHLHGSSFPFNFPTRAETWPTLKYRDAPTRSQQGAKRWSVANLRGG